MKIEVYGRPSWYRRPGIVGYACLLIGISAAAVLALGKLDGTPQYRQSVVFLGGAICMGYGLTRLFPKVLGGVFQFLGYVVGFSLLLAVVYWQMGKELPKTTRQVQTLVHQSFESLPNPQAASDCLKNPTTQSTESPEIEVVEQSSKSPEKPPTKTTNIMVEDDSASDSPKTAVVIPSDDPESEPKIAESPPPSADNTLAGEVISITDGDTLTILINKKQVKIRLAEIDTPERRQRWGRRARQALADKVFRQTIRVEPETVDRYGRLVARVWLGDRDINREMVRDGHAWVYREYMTDPTLLDDENAAREQELGLWSQPDPTPPWEWRRRRR